MDSLACLLLCVQFVPQRSPDQLCGYTVMRTSASANAHFMDPLRKSVEGIQVTIMLDNVLAGENAAR